MKQFVFAIASIMACAMAAVEASAATFHVSTSGADSNPGTVAEPWASLQHAVDTIQPGDTILIESGTYPGCRIGNSGLATAVCTLKASSGAQVLVNAPGPGNKHASNIEIENFDATVQYWVIDGLESAGSPKYGIDIRGTDHITVRNCFVHGSAATGIFMAFCDHPLIESNESSLNAEHGIYDSNSGDFPVIRGNKIHDNRNAGIHINGDQNFTPGDGIISFALVEQNIIYENGIGGASGINCDGVSDSIIRNNLLYNNHASGISLYATDGAEGSSRDKVYNNTIVMASGARWCVNIPASDNGQPNPTGDEVENNILYTPGPGRGSVLVYAATGAGLISDFNVVVDRFSVDAGGSVMALAAWQGLGFDKNSIVASVADLFVSPATNDYHLKAGSVAIGAGASLAGVTDDLEGHGRPQGSPYSIGCYEGPAAPPPVTTDFTPVSFSVLTGVLVSGTLASLDASDGRYLKIKAVKLDGLSDDDVEYDFQGVATTASEITITSVSHPTLVPEREQFSLFNFNSGVWDLLATLTLSIPVDTTTTVSVTNPANYISSGNAVRLRVRTGDTRKARFKHFVDLIKITASP